MAWAKRSWIGENDDEAGCELRRENERGMFRGATARRMRGAIRGADFEAMAESAVCLFEWW